MMPSDDAFNLIKQEEGFVPHTYIDAVGVPTIGYGSTLNSDGTKVRTGQIISQVEAERLMVRDATNKAAHIVALCKPVELKQNQIDSLTSLVYNIGVGAFEKSTLLNRIKSNASPEDIMAAFQMWNKGHKDGKLITLDGLTQRRKKEADLFLK